MRVKYLILGAGPAGLSLACSLLKKGEKDFFILEKDNEVGGLCRSRVVDGAPLDIGGGHFLDIRRPLVCDFLFEYMPKDEWREYARDSRIRFSQYELHHPFEANIWELPEDVQEEFLASIASAGCNTGAAVPERFVDWIGWKLGDKIAETYMLPYNRKMFGDNLNDLGTYWLEKLPNTSYEETLRSCREKRAFTSQPGHARFYYPKEYGYGEIWKRMGESLKERLKLSEEVKVLDFDGPGVVLSDGVRIDADIIITTVPWKSMELKNASGSVKADAERLRHTSIEVTYCAEDFDTDAQWIYFPDEGLSYHRILVRKNFFEGAKGYWTETRSERYAAALAGAGASSSSGNIAGNTSEDTQGNTQDNIQGSIQEDIQDNIQETEDCNFHSEYAYPVNTIDKPRAIAHILDEAKRAHIIGLGRWGEHSHYNSDLVVEKGIALADELLS